MIGRMIVGVDIEIREGEYMIPDFAKALRRTASKLEDEKALLKDDAYDFKDSAVFVHFEELDLDHHAGTEVIVDT